jgi:hypothetical protein
MITSIIVDGLKLYGSFTTTTNNLSVVGLQGYNFDKILNVILSGSNTAALPSLTTIDIFKRQSPITGALISYTVIDKNNLLVEIPRLIESSQLQIIPYNVAGYSTSSTTLYSQTYSAYKTFLNVISPTVNTFIRPVSSFTYRRPDGRSLFLRN